MSRIGDFFRRLFRKEPLRLEEGKDRNFESESNGFKDRIREITTLSPEERAQRDAERKELAAFNCLAKMVATGKFDDQTFLGESEEKGMYRLQAEAEYKNYGHGADIPVNDNILRVFREIQRLAVDGVDRYQDGFGMVRDDRLEKMLQENNMQLETILRNGGKKISEKIDMLFRASGRGYIDFNSDYERPYAMQAIQEAIVKEFSEYIREIQQDQQR